VFEEEKKKLEQRKRLFDNIAVPMDKLHFAVRSGFEKAKKERTLKRRMIRKRSTWSIAIAAILLISFVTSISVSPVFASKVASIPGLDKIVSLIKQDRGLTAAVENDFYQPINLSQQKNGITVTLDGVIADNKGMVIFYSVHTKEVDVKSLELKYLQLRSGYQLHVNGGVPLKSKQDTNLFSSSMHIERFKGKKDLNFAIGLINGTKIEHFKIPFTYKKMDVESKNIIVNKNVTIEGQRIKIKELIVDPIRVVVKLETDPNNRKKLLLNAFDELTLEDELGRTWSALPGTYYWNGDEWEVAIRESFYFYEPEKLFLTFGKVAAMDKDEAYILIDTESKKFLKQPSESIFSNLKIENGKVSFTIQVNEEYAPVSFPKFTDADGKGFLIKYESMPFSSKYVNGSLTDTAKEEKRLEFELPTESFSNPLRLDLDFYPSWIEEDVEVEIK